MHNKYFIVYNGQTNLDIDLLIKSRPSKPSPTKQHDEVDVPGRDGKLYIEKGYSDIEISVSFNFVSKFPEMWDKNFRKIKKWLNSKIDNKLKFSDDLGFFYRVNKVVIDTPERALKRIGRFNVTFTCEPYIYLETGQERISLPQLIYNEFEESQPIYYIKGEGVLNLTVNGVTVKANVGQNLVINTKLGLCYREDGTLNNIALTGNYKDLNIKEGNNTFSFTQGFSVEIEPNWRCI